MEKETGEWMAEGGWNQTTPDGETSTSSVPEDHFISLIDNNGLINDSWFHNEQAATAVNHQQEFWGSTGPP